MGDERPSPDYAASRTGNRKEQIEVCLNFCDLEMAILAGPMARRTSPKPVTGKLNIFGAKIRRLREAAGLRQNELTHRLQRAGWDVDPGTTNRIETGARTLTDIELMLILRVLGKRLSDLER